MKKLSILTVALCLSTMLLTGCGCTNTKTDVPVLPTNGEQSRPTQATQMPTTEATTAPATMPSTMPATDATDASDASSDTTGPLEGAAGDIMGGSTDDATGSTGTNRGRGRMMPNGNGFAK